MNGARRMIEGNLLIRASAGTGKTFALATRFIRLMLFDRVDPARIVALTFSRAAAQEIYTKLLERLCRASTDPDKAEAEHRNLIANLPADKVAAVEAQGIRWTPETFAGLLRKVVAVQHLGAIATLDSFILRLVGNFPLELGFQNALEVLDPAGERDEADRAVRSILGRVDDPDAFADAFRAAKKGCFARTCSRTLSDMLEGEGWRKFILGHPESATWTAKSMAEALGVQASAGGVSVVATARTRGEVADKTAGTWLDRFMAYLVKVKPGENPIPSGRTIAIEFAQAVARHPTAPYVEHVKASGDVVRCEYPPCVFQAAKEDLTRLADAYILRQLEVVEAKLRLGRIIEREYDAATRRSGKLTFQDFTDAAKDHTKIELDNLRFRFDAQLDHWALDEFQDTSEVQWACLRELVESAASGGGASSRSALAVGDLKQSIYTWRGGDDKPFEEMMSWPWFGTDADGTVYGRIENSRTSYRYGKRIADFINRVLGAENLRSGGAIPPSRATAVARWLREDCWQEHVPEYGADGAPKVRDYVRVVGVPPKEDVKAEEGLLDALCREVESVWQARAQAGGTESVGILVRRNATGTKIAEGLRKRNLPVVWEGVNAVSDVPVVQGVLQLLKLADHPEDTFAWTMVDALLPLRERLMPDVTSAAEASARVAELLSHQGLARTLKDFCGTLCRAESGLDGLSRARLHALVRLGVDYERRRSADYDMDGFARFVAAAGKRESSASAEAIRILSIHRAKGLTLDRVFVPIVENVRSSIVEPSSFSALYGPGCAWVLPHLPSDVAALNDKTRAVLEAQRDARLLEQLRLYYVALTRARKALYVLFPQEEHTQPLFRDLIVQAVETFERKPCENGLLLYEDGEAPAFTADVKTARESPPWRLEAPAVRVFRRSPSRLRHGSTATSPSAADTLFGDEYGAAARRGTDVHAAYARIVWADASQAAELPAAFRPAFVRPSPDATVWRERAYERMVGDCWETGQFDRVVFTGGPQARSATIYDFKTNALESGEDAAAFAARMRTLYAPQMEAYRQALAQLTGIPVARIRTELLLVAVGQSVVL